MSDPRHDAILATAVAQAGQCLRNGGIVAFPTETYYGLAADCFNETAVIRLFELKKRELSKPLLLLVADEKQLGDVVAEIPQVYIPLMKKYWPGPLTLLFPVKDSVPLPVSAGSGNIGVRISSHPVAAMLVAAAGSPITATSANISGTPAAENTAQIRQMFGPALSCIVDGGPTTGGAPSTIVGLRNNRPAILRQGILQLTETDIY